MILLAGVAIFINFVIYSVVVVYPQKSARGAHLKVGLRAGALIHF